MEGITERARDINTDKDIKSACDPNNEYMRFPNPVMWEDLEARRDTVRLNYFRRKFRFELKCVKGSIGWGMMGELACFSMSTFASFNSSDRTRYPSHRQGYRNPGRGSGPGRARQEDQAQEQEGPDRPPPRARHPLALAGLPHPAGERHGGVLAAGPAAHQPVRVACMMAQLIGWLGDGDGHGLWVVAAADAQNQKLTHPSICSPSAPTPQTTQDHR